MPNSASATGSSELIWEKTMKRILLWVVVVGMLMAGLAAGPDLWAAPGQSSARQTVPTPTPQLPPTEPPPSPTKPPPTPTPRSSGAQLKPTLTARVEANTPTVESPQPLLPSAGGRSIRLQFSMAWITLALLILAAGKWHVQ
jgi:hypothetical protein